MICVDASLAAKWILPERYSNEALDLVAASVQAGEPVVAPPLLAVEITNTLRQRMIRDQLPLAEARRLLNRFFAFPVTIMSPDALSEAALVLAAGHHLPAVYDAHYVALAQMLGCELWTDDQRLLRAIGGRLPLIKWIGNYP